MHRLSRPWSPGLQCSFSLARLYSRARSHSSSSLVAVRQGPPFLVVVRLGPPGLAVVRPGAPGPWPAGLATPPGPESGLASPLAQGPSFSSSSSSFVLVRPPPWPRRGPPGSLASAFREAPSRDPPSARSPWTCGLAPPPGLEPRHFRLRRRLSSSSVLVRPPPWPDRGSLAPWSPSLASHLARRPLFSSFVVMRPPPWLRRGSLTPRPRPSKGPHPGPPPGPESELSASLRVNDRKHEKTVCGEPETEGSEM